MCGIAGYAIFDEDVIDPTYLEILEKKLEHRGPDGTGVWISASQKVGFIHRRLSIVDTTSAGHQPMSDRQQSVVISYNGEIYNYREIRTNLETRGYSFTSHSDTEVFLYAYKEWGIECLKKFEGIFACALYDSAQEELYLIRDRFGVKPLYFSVSGNKLSFASEIKALLELPWIEKNVNHEAIYHYLSFLAVPCPHTFYKNIYKLAPGTFLKISKLGYLSYHTWYSIPFLEHAIKDPLEIIEHLLKDSVKKRVEADVPVGILFSGGVDSSMIVALASQFNHNLTTVTAAFDNGDNELEEARSIAQLFKTHHCEVMISEKEAFHAFVSVMYHQDEPLGDPTSIPSYICAHILRQQGVKVALLGEGADELFCGYEDYIKYLNTHQWFVLSQKMPGVIRELCAYTGAHLIPSRYQDIITHWKNGDPLFYSSVFVFPEFLKKNILSKQDYNSCFGIKEQYQELTSNTVDYIQKISRLEFKTRLAELLLMRVDKMLMAHGIEGREPFLDRALVEYVINLPLSYKYKDGITKYALKKIAKKFLPRTTIFRCKKGFTSPTGHWLKHGTYFKHYFLDMFYSKKSSLSEIFNVSLLEKKIQKGEFNSSQLWTLFNCISHEVF